jgi:hypothetical protein
MVMSLSNGMMIIIITKVKADKSQKKDRTVAPARMTPNKPHDVNVRESKHLVRSPRQTSIP